MRVDAIIQEAMQRVKARRQEVLEGLASALPHEIYLRQVGVLDGLAESVTILQKLLADWNKNRG
jgi:hypothetical protein